MAACDGVSSDYMCQMFRMNDAFYGIAFLVDIAFVNIVFIVLLNLFLCIIVNACIKVNDLEGTECDQPESDAQALVDYVSCY